MRTDLYVEFEARRGFRFTPPSRHVNVIETVLSKIKTSPRDVEYIDHRTIMRITWKRIWPFTWCRVKFMNGDIRASGCSMVLTPFGVHLGTAILTAAGRAGFHVMTDGYETKPWRINKDWITAFVKVVGHMFKKEGEFVACRRIHL